MSLVVVLREAAGLTQEEAAARAGMSVRGLSNLERGQVARPRRTSLDALATALGLTERDRRRLFDAYRPTPAAAPDAVSWRGPRSSLRELVGRDAELAELRRALGEHDLVTVTGPGGCGKTALALAAVAGSPVPVTVLTLGQLARPEQLVPALVTLLQIPSGGPEAALDAVERALGAGRQLLVVDNAEHLADAVVDLLVRLRGSCPELTVLVTSREPLGLSEELVWRLLPLRAPVDDADAHAPAAQLFRRRITEALPTADLSDAAAIGRICRRLDGLPLALELAAARVRALPVPELADRLDRGVDLLTSTVPGPGGRRTLEQTIDWSYRLLDPHEQLALVQLSVFAGAFDADAVEAVVAARGAPLALAAQLVDRSLLQAEPGGRYVMLRTIRDYAAHRLAGTGELAATRGRHLDHWLERGRRLNAVAAFGPRQEVARVVAADLADAEHALTGGLAVGRDVEVVELAHNLLDCWNVATGHMTRGERWLAVADRLGDRCPPRLRAVARTNRAQLLSALGDKPACHAQLLAAYADADALTVDERLDIVGMLLQTEGRLLDPAAPGRADQLLAQIGPCSDDQLAASLEAIVTVDLLWDRWDRMDALLAQLGELVGTVCGWLTTGYQLQRAQVAARRGDGPTARAALDEAAAALDGTSPGRWFGYRKSMAEVLLSLDAAADAHALVAAQLPILGRIPDLGWKAPLLHVPMAEAMRRLGLPGSAGALRLGLEVARADRMVPTALNAVLVAAAALTDAGDTSAGGELAASWQQVRRTIGLPVPDPYRRTALDLGLDVSTPCPAPGRAAAAELEALGRRALAAL